MEIRVSTNEIGEFEPDDRGLFYCEVNDGRGIHFEWLSLPKIKWMTSRQGYGLGVWE